MLVHGVRRGRKAAAIVVPSMDHTVFEKRRREAKLPSLQRGYTTWNAVLLMLSDVPEMVANCVAPPGSEPLLSKNTAFVV